MIDYQVLAQILARKLLKSVKVSNQLHSKWSGGHVENALHRSVARSTPLLNSNSTTNPKSSSSLGMFDVGGLETGRGPARKG